jgi:hypothetical protein
MNRFAVLAPDGPLYRLARAPEPWAWPDWAYAGLDGTFGNRWDDPWAATAFSMPPRGAWALSSRPSPASAPTSRSWPAWRRSRETTMPRLQVSCPRRWLQGRRIAEATIAGAFVDIGDAGSLATLRVHLAARAIHDGLSEIDAATIRPCSAALPPGDLTPPLRVPRGSRRLCGHPLPLTAGRPVRELGDLRAPARHRPRAAAGELTRDRTR